MSALLGESSGMIGIATHGVQSFDNVLRITGKDSFSPLGEWPVVAASPDAGANRPEDIVKAAVKFDAGKARWDLIPWDAMEQLANLYSIGAVKYADNNWLKGFRYGRTVAAMLRHLMAWWLAKLKGEDGLDHDNDEICKQLGINTPSHLVAVIWNAVALLTFELRGLGEDDRPTRPAGR